MRGLAVAVGIAHIDGGGKAVFTDDGPDVVGLGPACVAGTEMAGKIMAQPGGFEKTLDIARLAVADNIKRKAGGKDAQGILQSLIGKRGILFQCFILGDEAFFKKFVSPFGAAPGEQDSSDFIEKFSEELLQVVAGDLQIQIRLPAEQIAPGAGYGIRTVPKRSVYIENDTVCRHIGSFFLIFL